MKNKLRLIFKNIICAINNNKLRTVLTMVGIIISGIMVIMGTFIIEGYYNGKVAVLEKTPKDTLVVKTDSDNVKKLEQNYIDIYDSKYKCMDYSYSIYGCETKGKNFNLECNLIGISNMGNNIMEVLDYNTHITRSILVEGRLINNSDISQKRRVIVINSYVAKIMFNNESALGQYINIDVGNGETKNESFKVIGVIENSKYDERRVDILKIKLASDEYENVGYDTCTYIPISVLEDIANSNADDEIKDNVIEILQYNNVKKIEKTKDNIRRICNGNIEIFDYENELNNIKNEVMKYKNIFLVIFCVIFVFSGLNIMNVCFFSIKERVSEIGVRKAYGASSTMIIIQFMLENIIIACISYLISVIVGSFLLEIVRDISSKYWGMIIIYDFSLTNGIFPLVLVEFETVIFSIVPCIYASKIKVVKALRFE